MQGKSIVPIFFAVDENYLPYLSVTLTSIKEHINGNNVYNVYILHSGLDEKNAEKIKSLSSNNFNVYFVDVSFKLDLISKKLNLRDYYTTTTYYRIFIAEMFPEYDKAIYLDSDTVVLEDIVNLFDIDMKGNIIAGIPDGAVGVIKPFQDYVKYALGIDPEKYFNAGIILMDLNEFRRTDFYGKFNSLLEKYKFTVAQDQDYLNVLCHGRVLLLDGLWNVMPLKNAKICEVKNPKIIHYNLTAKPWHYDDISYQEYFWEYAKKTEFYDYLLNVRRNFSDEEKENDFKCEDGLIKMCIEEAANEKNYFNLYVKEKKKIG